MFISFRVLILFAARELQISLNLSSGQAEKVRFYLTILNNFNLHITFREVDVGKLVCCPVLAGEVLQQTLDRSVRGADQVDRLHGGHRLASLLYCFTN